MQVAVVQKLNLGSGKFPKEGFVNLDFRADVGADVVHNLNTLPLPFSDNSFSHIEADHVLEHVEDPFRLMRELHRILVPDGTLSIRVPHFSRGFTHPEHKRGFDVSFPLYFNPLFQGGYEGVTFVLMRLRLHWFAQRYLKKITLGSVQYTIGVICAAVFDTLAFLSPYAASRIWCFWVGGFEEVHFIFRAVKNAPHGTV